MASDHNSVDNLHHELRQRYHAALRAARDSLRAATDVQRAAQRARTGMPTVTAHRPPRQEIPANTSPGDDEVALLRQELHDLRQALATRDLIWSAKTIIASTTGADPDEAHRLLVRQSQHENRKLREVAAEIVGRHQREAS